jgi:hypothetical protein
MAQEIISPGHPQIAGGRGQSDVELIEYSIDKLRGKLNLFDKMKARRLAGRTAATVVLEMQRDVAEAQREVVQYHTNELAKTMKLEIGDAFQQRVDELKRRVYERTDKETVYYQEKLAKREDFYETFFQERIRGYQEKVKTGEMSEERARQLISRCEKERDVQQERDRDLVEQLIEACLRIVRNALKDFRPT